MKKTITTLAILLMAILMILSAVPVMATGNIKATEQGSDGKITIDNAKEGYTYSIYKIFNLVSFDKDNNRYSYTVDEAWKGFVKDNGPGAEYVVYTEPNVTWNNAKNTASDYETFAKLALKYASENNIAATQTKKQDTGSTVTFDNLNYGYYLVESTLGALVSLGTTNNEVTIKEKNDIPTLKKEIDEGNVANEDIKENSASVGDEVKFQITIEAKRGAEKYVVTDKLSEGLKLKLPVMVDTLNASKIKDTYTSSSFTNDDNGFTLTLEKDYLDKLFENTDPTTTSKTITITYSATVTADIVKKNQADNTVSLNYDNDPNTTDELSDKTTTKTHEFTLKKVDEQKNELTGAKFKLLKSDQITAISLFKDDTDSNNIFYRPVDSQASTPETGVDEIDAGTILIKGLDAGTYYLEETEAPAGYNKLTDKVKVEIAKDGTVTVTMPGATDGSAVSDKTVTVVNKSGSELPSTGGIGTVIFYAVGGLLMLVTLVVLIARRKTSPINR